MQELHFEWDEKKNHENTSKHGVSFEEAKRAFYDKHRLIIEDSVHSKNEKRFFCVGYIDRKIITVRFTERSGNIRIFGAGYWRRGKKIYETLRLG